MEAHAASPAPSPGLRSLNELLLWHGEGGIALRRYVKRDGGWQGLDSPSFYHRVRALETALRQRLGVAAGERVAILAESSPEWLLADFACLAAAVIDVPIYPTLTADQVAFILRDSGAAGVFVSTPELEAKIRSVIDRLPELRWVSCFADATWQAMLETEPGESSTAFAARLRATPPEQLATLLYTSGTTGDPKGLLLTHANLCANLNYSTLDFRYGHNECRLSILPLAHITERHMAYVDMVYGGEMYFAESFDRVAANLAEVRPTVLVSVPRLFEKVADALQAQVAQKPALQRALFRWAVKVGEAAIPYRLAARRPPLLLRSRAALADRLAGRKLRTRLGGRLNKIISGGAALAPAVARLLLALGVMVDVGYGLSETSPVIALSRPGHRRLGSVGRPLDNVEVQVAADGEILVRGPSVFA
ncbi:MAG: AMP-dependent synthetase/ligase, partial [Terriglobales bacterium]